MREALHRRVTRRVDPLPLGVVRAVVGGAAVLKALIFAPIVLRIADPQRLRVQQFNGLPEPGELALLVAIGLWIAGAIMLMLGWRTRIAGMLLVGVIGYLLILDPQLYSNHLYLLWVVCGLLTLADSGAAFSLDARAGRGQPTVAGWPVDLLKVQISVVYLFAALSKINLPYISGGILAATWRWEGALALPAGLKSVEVLFPLAMISIFMEAFLAIGLWVRRWRAEAFVVGLALHLGIVAVMSPVSELLVFAALSLSLYVLFLDRKQGSHLVVWDDSCTFCVSSVRWFARLDWLRVNRFVGSSDSAALLAAGISRAEADQALQLVAPHGRDSGFAAVAAVLESLPISFLWAPLLRLPGVRHVGERAYRAVALRRRCALTQAPAGALLTSTRR